jgi:hypothetical protein
MYVSINKQLKIFKPASALHRGSARERFERGLLMSKARASNIALCREQYVDRESGLENDIP